MNLGSCLRGVLFRLKGQVGKVKSELKLHCLMLQLASTPPSATHQQEFSIRKRTNSLPQAFLSKWTKVSVDCICKRRERETKAGEEGRRKGSLRQQQPLFFFLWFCTGRAADMSAPYHSWTRVTPTAALMLTDYCLLALLDQCLPCVN